MNNLEQGKKNWRQWILHELTEYAANAVYLALVFAAFTQYRRILLAAHDISYTNYWVAVIEGLILGKVIMIGTIFRLGRGLEGKPLIYPTLYKAVVFSVLVGVFTVVEHVLKGLLRGEAIAVSLAELFGPGLHELLAGSLVIFVALVPFFAVKELQRMFGAEKLRALFFQRKPERWIEHENHRDRT